MFCTFCGQSLSPEAGFCSACGNQVPAAAGTGLGEFLDGMVSVSLKEIVLVDKIAGSQILKSPVFRFLCLVAAAPLAIEALESNRAILNGLAVWSGFLWCLLLYRLFADRELRFAWAFGTVLFTAFVGLPILELWLAIPLSPLVWLAHLDFLPAQLIGHVLGTGVREELCKALPLLLLALFSKRLKNPTDGLVLGMMSGVGFAMSENVYYVYRSLESAIGAANQTRNLAYLVTPIYNNVVRMAMTPFLHGCFSGIFGYFIALASVDKARRFALLLAGLSLAAGLHGLYDTLVGRSPLYGVVLEGASFFLLMTYILKSRGLGSAHELGGGVFSRTVMTKVPLGFPAPAAVVAREGVAAEVVVVPMVAAGAAARSSLAATLEPQSAAGLTPRPPRPVAALDPGTLMLSELGEIEMAGASEASPAPGLGAWQLRGVAGTVNGRVYPLSAEVRVGRDASQCGIAIGEGVVSRQHAVLSWAADGHGWEIRRLSTTAPLFVNGASIEEARLAAGDQVQVGSSVLVFEAL